MLSKSLAFCAGLPFCSCYSCRHRLRPVSIRMMKRKWTHITRLLHYLVSNFHLPLSVGTFSRMVKTEIWPTYGIRSLLLFSTHLHLHLIRFHRFFFSRQMLQPKCVCFFSRSHYQHLFHRSFLRLLFRLLFFARTLRILPSTSSPSTSSSSSSPQWPTQKPPLDLICSFSLNSIPSHSSLFLGLFSRSLFRGHVFRLPIFHASFALFLHHFRSLSSLLFTGLRLRSCLDRFDATSGPKRVTQMSFSNRQKASFRSVDRSIVRFFFSNFTLPFSHLFLFPCWVPLFDRILLPLFVFFVILHLASASRCMNNRRFIRQPATTHYSSTLTFALDVLFYTNATRSTVCSVIFAFKVIASWSSQIASSFSHSVYIFRLSTRHLATFRFITLLFYMSFAAIIGGSSISSAFNGCPSL